MDFTINRGDFAQCKFVDSEDATPPQLEPGQVSLRVDKFAFTANNITYAVAGDMLSYWKFFPADAGWGRIPVWGIGIVDDSTVDDIELGERFYGYFPMSNHLIVSPTKVKPQGFADATPHRQELPPTYNRYSRMTPELGFNEDEDDYTMIFRPLFMTSFLLDDFIADNDFFGATTVVLSSASSKTAFGLAFLLAQRDSPNCNVVGLTSPGNKAFVEGLGCYDTVVTYENIAALATGQPAVFVDMAGNAEVLATVHQRFGDQLKYSCQVGITHWQKAGPPQDLPGAKPKMFFAPDHIQKRTKEWGPEGIQQRFTQAWEAFMKPVSSWIQIQHGQGPDAIEKVYKATLNGAVKPSEGHILSP